MSFFICRVGLRFLGKVRYFLLLFFLSVTDFVFILLKLVLGSFWSVGCSRVDLWMDIVLFWDQQRVVSGSSWVIVGSIGLVMFCFREVDIGIGKLDEKFDDVFLTERLSGKEVVEVVGMLSAF